MGVLGLTSFIENNPQLLQSSKLHDSRVVIDGHGLVHNLFFYNKVGYRHGGNYTEYEKLCTNFFRSMKLCNVQAYVLFDGAHDVDDKKLKTVKERAKQQIQRSLNIISGGGDKILPVFAFEVFRNVLEKLKVPFVYCDFEADGDIVALANAWACPAVGQDSDFFIFDIKAGYIPLTHLWWKNPCILSSKEESDHDREPHPILGTKEPKSRQYYIITEKYNLSTFCSHFTINNEMMPLLASLLGNDYISSETFNDFFCQVKLPVHYLRRVSKRTAHVQGTINWLSEFEVLRAAITTVLKYLRKTDREKIGEKLDKSMQAYNLQEGSKFMNYFDRDHMDVGLMEIRGCPALPGWCMALFRHGILPAFCFNIICQRRHFTFDLIEDVSEASCNNASLDIRKVLYGLLLKEVDSMSSSRKQIPLIVEYDRKLMDLGQTPIEPILVLPNFGDLPFLSTIPTLSVSAKKGLLAEVLGIESEKLTNIPSELKLAIGVTIYWIKRAKPKVSTIHVQALLLCFLKGYFTSHYQESKISNVPDDDTGDIENVVAMVPKETDRESLHKKDKQDKEDDSLDVKEDMSLVVTEEATGNTGVHEKSDYLEMKQGDASLETESAEKGKRDKNHGSDEGENISKVKSSQSERSDVSMKGCTKGCKSTKSKTTQSSPKQLLIESFKKFQGICKEDRINVSAIQAFSQWQSCMKYTSFLNAILCQPYPVPDITRLYHGTLIHSMNYMLRSLLKSEPLEWIQRTLLVEIPEAYGIYESMHTTVMSCVNQDMFYRKKSKKSREVIPEVAETTGQNDQREECNDSFSDLGSSPPLQYEVSCDVVNRFSSLMTFED
ncbi:single-strand DNA endonuclease ASTE1-like [Glandiceps talaboti]